MARADPRPLRHLNAPLTCSPMKQASILPTFADATSFVPTRFLSPPRQARPTTAATTKALLTEHLPPPVTTNCSLNKHSAEQPAILVFWVLEWQPTSRSLVLALVANTALSKCWPMDRLALLRARIPTAKATSRHGRCWSLIKPGFRLIASKWSTAIPISFPPEKQREDHDRCKLPVALFSMPPKNLSKWHASARVNFLKQTPPTSCSIPTPLVSMLPGHRR